MGYVESEVEAVLEYFWVMWRVRDVEMVVECLWGLWRVMWRRGGILVAIGNLFFERTKV